jgi:hypothetical protein
MEYSSSFLYSHHPTTGHYLDSYESSPHPSTLFKIHFNSVLPSPYRLSGLVPSRFLANFPQKFFICTVDLICNTYYILIDLEVLKIIGAGHTFQSTLAKSKMFLYAANGIQSVDQSLCLYSDIPDLHWVPVSQRKQSDICELYTIK